MSTSREKGEKQSNSNDQMTTDPLELSEWETISEPNEVLACTSPLDEEKYAVAHDQLKFLALLYLYDKGLKANNEDVCLAVESSILANLSNLDMNGINLIHVRYLSYHHFDQSIIDKAHISAARYKINKEAALPAITLVSSQENKPMPAKTLTNEPTKTEGDTFDWVNFKRLDNVQARKAWEIRMGKKPMPKEELIRYLLTEKRGTFLAFMLEKYNSASKDSKQMNRKLTYHDAADLYEHALAIQATKKEGARGRCVHALQNLTRLMANNKAKHLSNKDVDRALYNRAVINHWDQKIIAKLADLLGIEQDAILSDSSSPASSSPSSSSPTPDLPMTVTPVGQINAAPSLFQFRPINRVQQTAMSVSPQEEHKASLSLISLAQGRGIKRKNT